MKKFLAFFLIVVSLSCNRNNKIGYVVPVVDPTNTYDNRSVGVSSYDILNGKKYKAINLEICYVLKHQLPDSVITDAVNFLNRYCYKPGGIYVSQVQLPQQGGGLTVDNLITIEKIYRTKYEKTGIDGVDTLGLFVLVTDGDYVEKNVLGIAYKNTSVAIFDGIITAHADTFTHPTRSSVLSAVMKHEMGHLLGLVNSGSEMQVGHQDAGHGKHCNNELCMMHYKVQTTDVVAMLNGGYIPALDANCEADLRANGGK